MYRIKLIFVVLLIMSALAPISIAWPSRQHYLGPGIQLEPVSSSPVQNLSYITLVRPMPVYILDFDDIDNESLKYFIARTQYSVGIKVPSQYVYVSNGWLILRNTHHMLLTLPLMNNTLNPWSKLFDENLVLYIAYVRFLGGASRYYARGGIGLYEVRGVTHDDYGAYFRIAGYWISVLGRFTSRQQLSYDFEGHWSLSGYRWIFSEAVVDFKFKVNRTYALWIARSKNYIVGGIVELNDSYDYPWLDPIMITSMSKHVFYINDVNTWPGVVAWRCSIAIKRIEVYSIKPLVLGQVYRENYIPSVKLVTYTRFFNILRYERLSSKTYYWLFRVVDYDPIDKIVYYSIRKTLAPTTYYVEDLNYRPLSLEYNTTLS